MWTMNFQMFKLDLEKAEEPETKCQYPLDHQKSKGVPEKHPFLLYWLCQILWLCGSQYTVENSERDGNPRPPDLPLEKPICRSGATVRTGRGTTDWFQIRKGVRQAVYCHPAHLTYMQSTSWETLGWRKHKLESRLLEEIPITSDLQMTPPLWQKLKNN